MKSSSAPPLIATAVLLLPTLYVASYLALVVPQGVPYAEFYSYRAGKELPERFYWPLEQIDRRLRSAAWPEEDRLGIDFYE
jgi:hypothetical protein